MLAKIPKGSPHGAMDKVLDDSREVSKFKLQSSYYISKDKKEIKKKKIQKLTVSQEAFDRKQKQALTGAKEKFSLINLLSLRLDQPVSLCCWWEAAGAYAQYTNWIHDKLQTYNLLRMAL